MVARNRARYLAPIVLVAVIVATLLVVRSGLSTKHDSAAAPPTITLPASTHRATRKRFYVVRSGDTLSTISAKVGVPVATLEALNPSVGASSLQIGQRLKLR